MNHHTNSLSFREPTLIKIFKIEQLQAPSGNHIHFKQWLPDPITTANTLYPPASYANKCSPSRSDKNAAVSWPRTLLPAMSSGGE